MRLPVSSKSVPVTPCWSACKRTPAASWGVPAQNKPILVFVHFNIMGNTCCTYRHRAARGDVHSALGKSQDARRPQQPPSTAATVMSPRLYVPFWSESSQLYTVQGIDPARMHIPRTPYVGRTGDVLPGETLFVPPSPLLLYELSSSSLSSNLPTTSVRSLISSTPSTGNWA